ncbi:putative pilus system protein FilA [Acinetobacter bereziniae]|uniref:putative pilus system protein FilA n=1 Tax=Acinetobacter bereziniae TaxID=106648 RepID=UPI003215E1D4
MKLFTKLALVSAVAVSSNAMALQAMDDAALSATTGQDGINVGIDVDKIAIAKLHVFDGDGLATASGGTTNAGAITLNDVVVTKGTGVTGNLANLVIDTDGGASPGAPFLNVGAAISALNIKLGKIEVNNVTGNAGAYKPGTASAEILSGLTVDVGATTANIQLGNTPQGAMIKLNGSMVGGLQISNLAFKDASAGGGGYIVLGGVKVTDNNSTSLALDADIAVKPTGLAITALKNTNGTDIYLTKVVLGGGTGFVPGTPGTVGTGTGTGSIGDVAITGMKFYNGGSATPNGVKLTISGH